MQLLFEALGVRILVFERVPVKMLEQITLSGFEAKVLPQGADVVATLPDTVDGYISSLGKRSRQHLQQYIRKLERTWGSGFRVTHGIGSEISLEDIDKVAEFNSRRLKAKGIDRGWSDEIKEASI